MKSNIVSLLVCALFVSATVAYQPYREFAPYDASSPNSCQNATGNEPWFVKLKQDLTRVGKINRLVTDYSSLNWFSEDYGHFVHRQPVAVFTATTASEVSLIVRLAYESRGTAAAFQIVNRGGSGNSGGFTQPYCSAPQVVLDLTAVNKVTISTSNRKGNIPNAWIGAGANWEKLVVESAKKGLRPPVIPDYLGLTIGGLISNGGLGAASIKYGPIVSTVLSAQVVLDNGEIDTITWGDNEFRAMRGGLGQFGVFVQVQFPLIASESKTRVFHILAKDFKQMSDAVRYTFKYGLDSIDGLQVFGFPNTRDGVSQNVAPEAQLVLVNSSVNAVTGNGKNYVYNIEVQVRGEPNNLLTKQQVQQFYAAQPSNRIDTNLVFFTDYNTPDWDNRLELTTIPFLVAIGAWQAPHPWGSFFFDGARNTENYFDTYYQGQDNALDLGFGLVFLYPYPSSVGDTDSALSVPNKEDIFWHVTVGRTTTIPGTYARQADANRVLWDGLNNVGEATFYPNGVLPNTQVSDWRKHFRQYGYSTFVEAKNAFDPKRVFADTRNLF